MPSALRPLLPPHGPASWLSWVVGLWVFLAEGLGLQAGLGGPWCRGGNLLQEEPDGRQGRALCRQRRLGSSEKADRGPDLGLESSPLSYLICSNMSQSQASLPHGLRENPKLRAGAAAGRSQGHWSPAWCIGLAQAGVLQGTRGWGASSGVTRRRGWD